MCCRPELVLRVAKCVETIVYLRVGKLPQIFFEEHRESKRESSSRSRYPQPLDNYETAERVWERLLSAHEFGDCLITVATSGCSSDSANVELSPTTATGVGARPRPF